MILSTIFCPFLTNALVESQPLCWECRTEVLSCFSSDHVHVNKASPIPNTVSNCTCCSMFCAKWRARTKTSVSGDLMMMSFTLECSAYWKKMYYPCVCFFLCWCQFLHFIRDSSHAILRAQTVTGITTNRVDLSILKLCCKLILLPFLQDLMMTWGQLLGQKILTKLKKQTWKNSPVFSFHGRYQNEWHHHRTSIYYLSQGYRKGFCLVYDSSHTTISAQTI